MIFNFNDVVMYGTFGVCIVHSIEKLNFTGKKQDYYILKNINSEKNVYYVPISNETLVGKMRLVCSKAEVDTLISQMNSGGLKWIEDDTECKEKFDGIIKSGDKLKMIMLLRTIYLRRKELAQSGKKLRSYDESCLKTAENMVFEEFAYVLGIDRLEVVKYIEEHIA